MLGVLMLVVHILMFGKLAKNFESGFYNSSLMKGSTRMTYMLAMYVTDIAHIIIFLAICEIVLYIFNFIIPAFWILTITYAFADPLYVYFYAYLCV